jgi:hypothetical protein
MTQIYTPILYTKRNNKITGYPHIDEDISTDAGLHCAEKDGFKQSTCSVYQREDVSGPALAVW